MNKEKYDYIEKNNNPNYKLEYGSDKIKIDIIPKYKNIDFEFHFLVYIYKKYNGEDNPFKNKCYIRKLVSNYESLNEDNIIIKKIEYKNGKFSDNKVETPELQPGDRVYSNVFGFGKIFEDIEEYVFYNEQAYEIYIQHQKETWVIIVIVIAIIILILGIVFLILRLRKKNSIELESNNKSFPLTNEAQS